WSAQAGNVSSAGYSDTVGTGSQPAGTATGTSVNLSWQANTTVAGRAVDGYLVTRYASASGGSATAAQGSCAAVPVTATTCTDTNVPGGTWYYAITPVLAAWHGNEGAR